MNVRFLNRHNTCTMSGICVETGDRLQRDWNPFACFFAAFDFINQHYTKTFDITYRLHMKKECDGHRNNFVILPKVEMCRLLNSAKQIIPFKFHFELEEEHNGYLTLVLHLVGTGLQHKGLLMLSRMLFEYPHNMCAKDALALRALGKQDDIDFTKIPLVSLYLLCISSTHFSTDECFIRQHNPDLIPFKELRRKLANKRRKCISLVTPYKDYPVRVYSVPTTTEDMNSEEDYNRRMVFYIHNIKANFNV